MAQVKITKIGNSMGVILPKSVIENLGLELGDSLTLSETRESISLSRNDAKFSRYVEYAREIMRDYDLTMRELAK
ncbi:MAG: AbrB/MazE/SpoVT family DNA-binding domain-containing protein [Pseudomonadota bacterium]